MRTPVRGDAIRGVLVHGEVCHEVLRSGSVPVFLVGREADDVTRPDHLRRGAAPLGEPDALGDVEDLAQGVPVPGRASPGGKYTRTR